jgi:DNA-binding XRE family transcriptional regulator
LGTAKLMVIPLRGGVAAKLTGWFKFKGLFMIIFAKRLKELRKAKGVYQKNVAEMLSIREGTYRAYEAGTIDPPTSKTIMLADYFDVSIDYLVGRSDEAARR